MPMRIRISFGAIGRGPKNRSSNMQKDPSENRSKDPDGISRIPQAAIGPLQGPIAFGGVVLAVIIFIVMAAILECMGR